MKEISCTEPWVLETNRIRYLIKGGRLLSSFFGYEDEAGAYSQVWIASTVTSALDGTEGLSRLCGNGPYLKDLIEAHPEQVLGEEHVKTWGNTARFLVKLLNSRDRLLVQAHPDGKMAKKYFHLDFGKTESWFVLDVEKDSAEPPCIYVGFRQGVTRENFRHLIEIQDTQAILDCLYRFEIEKGQVIFIPAGLPHALGSGSLVAELQEPVDITLRAERFRPDGSELPEESLHSGIGIEAMLDCFDFTCRTREETEAKIFVAPKTVYAGPGIREDCLLGREVTDRFGMNRIVMSSNGGTFEYNKENKPFAAVLVTAGEGRLVVPDGGMAESCGVGGVSENCGVGGREENRGADRAENRGAAFDAGRAAAMTGADHAVPLKQGTEIWLPHGVSAYRYETDGNLEVMEFYPPQKV